MKYRLKHVVEYVALRAVAGWVRILPYRGALFTGWIIAGLAFHVVRFRVAEAKRRIRSVFGDRFTEREVNRIAWQSLRNIVFHAVEIIRIPRMTREWLLSVADCEATLLMLKRHADTGQGGIIACPHMGSWEMAAVGNRFYGVPIFTFAAQQKNPLVDGFLNALRHSPGIDTIARGAGSIKDIIRRLKAGQMLAILPDVRMREGGILVPFLGGTANLGEGMAVLARQTGVPIFPALVTREGWARHRIVVLDPIQPDLLLTKEQDVRRMTEAVMRIVEEAIRRDPGQWFWYNKRWILDPVENR